MVQALTHLAAVLHALNASWRDLARITGYYASNGIEPADLAACHALMTDTIGAHRCAGAGVMLAPVAKGARLAIEAIVDVSGSKQVLSSSGTFNAAPWAIATRVGTTLFVSGVIPDHTLLDVNVPVASHETSGASSFFACSQSAYRRLALACDAIREAWSDCAGLSDIVRLHQHITPPVIDLAEFRRSRADLLRTGDFVSASVHSGEDDPACAGRDPCITIDAEGVIGPRRRVTMAGVWANPGGLHGVVSDEVAFFQAQMGRSGDGVTVPAIEPARHAAQVFANIDCMLAAARLSWHDVVHLRAFCRDRAQADHAAGELGERLGDHACAATCLIAGFFDPQALLEIEITAVP